MIENNNTHLILRCFCGAKASKDLRRALCLLSTLRGSPYGSHLRVRESAVSMAEGRDQGPHYIPELDPENPESGPKVKQRMLWFVFFAGLALLAAGAGLYVSGFENAGLIVAGIGTVVLAPLWVFAGF